MRAKGYPGLRELEVLKGLGDQAVVASICPANVTNAAASDFGYRPALSALLSRFRATLSERGCLANALPMAGDQADCHVTEVYDPPVGSSCDCSGPGRRSAPSLVTPELMARGACVCEIVQLEGPDRTICQQQGVPLGTVQSGWCYIDPGALKDASQCALVQSCPKDAQRRVRFVNPASEPRGGSAAYLHCSPNVPAPSMAVCP
jgi:hypothetical protein